jgi:hypothetical protein
MLTLCNATMATPSVFDATRVQTRVMLIGNSARGKAG